MPEFASPVDHLDAVLAWLAAEPADDPVVDLTELRKHLDLPAAQDMVGTQRLQALDLLRARTLDICSRFRPRLLTEALPLGRSLHLAAADLVDALLVLSEHYRVLLGELQRRWSWSRQQEMAVLSAQGLQMVGEAVMLSAMAGASVPFGLWQKAHALWRASGQMRDGGGVEATPVCLHYLRLLAISVSQPESLTARELQWLFDFLESIALDGELSTSPIQPEAASYWIDLAQDSPPVAIARKAAGQGGDILFFGPLALNRQVSMRIAWLEEKILEAEVVGLDADGDLLDPETSGLPEGLAPLEALTLLRRLRDRWATPPLRSQPRRRHQYRVQVAAGIKALWDLLRGTAGEPSEWMVYNESPGGYAILSVGGVDCSLSAGMVLALRRESTQGWTVCVVRWIRSDNPDQVELGLQVVSQGCAAVTVGFRGADTQSMSPALMLPPLSAVRPHFAIVAHAGTYASRRFILLHEDKHLYVAQCRVLGLDMQTASIELFQYEVDPYPI